MSNTALYNSRFLSLVALSLPSTVLGGCRQEPASSTEPKPAVAEYSVELSAKLNTLSNAVVEELRADSRSSGRETLTLARELTELCRLLEKEASAISAPIERWLRLGVYFSGVKMANEVLQTSKFQGVVDPLDMFDCNLRVAVIHCLLAYGEPSRVTSTDSPLQSVGVDLALMALERFSITYPESDREQFQDVVLERLAFMNQRAQAFFGDRWTPREIRWAK